MPSAFGGRAGFDVAVSHIFPQHALATIISVMDVAGDGGPRAGGGCEVGLLCSVLIPAQLRVGAGSEYQIAGTEALRVGPELSLFHLSV